MERVIFIYEAWVKPDKKVLTIHCVCGFSSSKKINTIPIGVNSNPLFKDITIGLKKANTFLTIDFGTQKNELIKKYLKQINELESSYEESYQRNKTVLSFIQTLIDNYDGTEEIRNSILNNRFEIYQCWNNNSREEFIKYYNEYNIIETIKIENAKNIKTITLEPDGPLGDLSIGVKSLLLLKDGRIASCSDNNKIMIFDPSNDYHCDQVIERHSKGITSICQLDDGTIVSCSNEGSLMIGSYTINKAHDYHIFKVVTLPNNRIASGSFDTTIKIWMSNPPYSDIPIKVLKGHRLFITSILYIKERDIMISGAYDRTIRLWNMSTYQCDRVIEGLVVFLLILCVRLIKIE